MEQRGGLGKTSVRQSEGRETQARVTDVEIKGEKKLLAKKQRKGKQRPKPKDGGNEKVSKKEREGGVPFGRKCTTWPGGKENKAGAMK